MPSVPLHRCVARLSTQLIRIKPAVVTLFCVQVDAVSMTKLSSTETNFPIYGLKIRADYMDNGLFIQPKRRYKTKYLLSLFYVAQNTIELIERVIRYD